MQQREPSETSTPRDDFPPYGYLDNPYHSWKLNPSGVLRSRPPAGMGWHVPNYGSYGRNQFQYRAHLHVGLEVAGHRLLTVDEVRAAGAAVSCDLHTANRLRFRIVHPSGVRLATAFFLVDEHTLGCRVELMAEGQAPESDCRELTAEGTEDAEQTQRVERVEKVEGVEAEEGLAHEDERQSRGDVAIPLSFASAASAPSSVISVCNSPVSSVRLWLALEVAHNPATSRLWEHGLYAVLPGASELEAGTCGLVGVCPEGNAWAHGAARNGEPLSPAAAFLERAPWQAPWQSATSGTPQPSGGEPAGLQMATLLLAYDLVLPTGGEPLVIAAALARGVGPDHALAALRSALASESDGIDVAYNLRAGEDERFWQDAPRLLGDWPDHWRRGFATDLETLRMVARPPAGVFRSRWDGMQIQAPRIVLAEAALDALAISWADPALARELLLACFASAPSPNVPCMREDGSYNMIADDGSVCGTGPEWGWPFAVLDALFRRTGNSAWLATVYPGAAAYIDWWLAHRVDADGWMVHACSWESGQDVSTRFGAQSTGGSDVRHLRPVDLQAAAAHACELLAEWAVALGRPVEEIARWRERSVRLRTSVREMWRDAWFRDFDTRSARWSDVRDPMQLAPLACRLASEEQRDALRPAFDALPPHAGAYPPLAWPPVAHTILEAALACGLDGRASDMAAAVLERTWRRMDGMPEAGERDARGPEPDGALPGVTREYWPEGALGEPLPGAGIEGYGWGALTVHFLVRYLAGLRELSPGRFQLVPAIPASWRHPGARFVLGPLAYGGGRLAVAYAVSATDDDDPNALDIALTVAGMPGRWIARDEATGTALAHGDLAGGESLRLTWRGEWLRPVLVERR